MLGSRSQGLGDGLFERMCAGALNGLQTVRQAVALVDAGADIAKFVATHAQVCSGRERTHRGCSMRTTL